VKRLIASLEPVWWGLFVTGTALSAILLPGWILTIGLGVGFAPDALSYDRVHALGANLLGRAFLVVLVVACLWNGAHHLRHFNIDLGGLSRDAAVATLLYALAAAGSLLAVVAALRL
jgi:fumarate reductase subunit D